MNALLETDVMQRRNLEAIFAVSPVPQDPVAERVVGLGNLALQSGNSSLIELPANRSVWATAPITYTYPEGEITFTLMRPSHRAERRRGIIRDTEDPTALIVNEAWYDPLTYLLPRTTERPATVVVDTALASESQLLSLTKILLAISGGRDMIDPRMIKPKTPVLKSAVREEHGPLIFRCKGVYHQPRNCRRLEPRLAQFFAAEEVYVTPNGTVLLIDNSFPKDTEPIQDLQLESLKDALCHGLIQPDKAWAHS